jgi:phage-related tail fiber protein
MRGSTLLVLAPIVVVAAGCGGGAKSPDVANLAGNTGTTGATTMQNDSGSSGKALSGQGGPRGQFRLAMNVGAADGTKFSACMRKHGVANFPDPNSEGVITIDSGKGIDPGSPAFKSAQSICNKLLPNGGRPTPAQIAQQQQKLLAFSACMRSHGLKDFPDPSNGGLRIDAHPGSDLDPANPTFQSAQKACQKYAPFKGGG